ncbi:DUF397 domain-containing protein [Nocardiopsis potens]|uniref:DUF397 domain-containing protein n=1 Tax=Nocardiopsis potens TaxID=1246458 RepID=UPI00034A770C|nr:DUF397 domain-containing protein [Nocardiopsis potens]
MTSTRSIPNALFRKSSYSQPQGGNCVEVAETPAVCAVRDSLRPDAGHLGFPAAEWAAFVRGVRSDLT